MQKGVARLDNVTAVPATGYVLAVECLLDTAMALQLNLGTLSQKNSLLTAAIT